MNEIIKFFIPILLVGVLLVIYPYLLSINYHENYTKLIYSSKISFLILFVYAILFYTNFIEHLSNIIYKKTSLLFSLILFSNFWIMKKIKFLELLGILK